MSTVACAGCGMPRAAELVGSTGCPVCGHVVTSEPAFDPPREWAAPKVEPPPPALIPEPARVAPTAKSGRPVLLAGLAFAVGSGAGVGGTLAWQQRTAPTPVVAVSPAGTPTPLIAPQPVAVAPMPREVVPVVAAAEPTPPVAAQAVPVPAPAVAAPVAPAAAAPAPVAPAVVPAAVPVVVKAAGKAVHIDVNEPDGTYTLMVPTRRGEHVVLRGKVGKLKLSSVEAGSTLDASELEAGEITLGGKIDGGSVVKLNAPTGTVVIEGRVDGGSQLSVTGRFIYLSGEVGGEKTRVNAVINRAGTMRGVGVNGTAVVEYELANGGWSETDVLLGDVAPGAIVRKAGEK